jgi:transcription elongation factor GreA
MPLVCQSLGMPNDPSALELLRASGLMADGPATWGQQVRSRQPGVFLVELPTGFDAAPIDHAAVRGWIERVPGLRLDGEPPTPAALVARLGSFWLPRQRVLYVGRTQKSLGGRVGAMYATQLGERRPHPGGYWLKTLQGLDRLRIWWAETEAPEEYEDALLNLFAQSVPVVDRGAQPEGTPLLPWATLETTMGDRRETGITGAFADDAEADAGAKGAGAGRAGTAGRAGSGSAAGRGSAAARTATGTAAGRSTGAGARATRTATGATGARPTARPRATKAAAPMTGRSAGAKTFAPADPPTHVTADGLAALEAELEDLRTVQRPQVILRVKGARELGDLRENADYEAARNEQSFLEGRIRTLEQMIRSAVVIGNDRTGEVMLGSTVRVGIDGEEQDFHIVGSTEADPVSGRISNASPVGRALMGHRAGDEVTAQLPGRQITYRIIEVS